MNEIEELKHRLAMVNDDLQQIIKFIDAKRLGEVFEQPSEMADACWQHISNIEIATDLSTDECLAWQPFPTEAT